MLEGLQEARQKVLRLQRTLRRIEATGDLHERTKVHERGPRREVAADPTPLQTDCFHDSGPYAAGLVVDAASPGGVERADAARAVVHGSMQIVGPTFAAVAGVLPPHVGQWRGVRGRNRRRCVVPSGFW